MINKEFAEKMRNDRELQELRRKVIAITGKMGDASYCLGRETYDGFKARLRKIVEDHEATSETSE